MKRVFCALLLSPVALLGQAGRGCQGVGVHEDRGTVFVQCASGEALQIGAQGQCSKPFLSRSGDYAFFLEGRPPERAEIGLAQRSKGWATEGLLMFPVAVDGRTSHEVLDYRPWNVGCGAWVLADYSATTFILLRVRCEPRQVTKVCTASAACELSSGPFKGDIVVLARVPAPPGDPMGRVVQYVYQIVTPTGTLVRSIGEGRQRLRDFLGFDPDLWPPPTGAPEKK